MKLFRAFVLTLVFFGCIIVLGSKVLAQTPAGLLGQRYTGLALFTENLRDSDIANGTGATLLVNVPVASFVDFEASGSFESFPDYKVRDQRAFAGLTVYRDFNSFKAFVLTSIGSTWQSSKVNGTTYRANEGSYALGAGLEIPFTDTSAIFGRMIWNRYFDDKRGHYWTYTAGANHWFNQKFGAMAAVSFFDSSSVIFSLGVNVRF